ncbi:Tubulin_tyrosine ligase [Hexamita inflata]|uniref:Tubulin tyrosine ligase n=1 Tax=Hexamita inflata TaxID=28002 RepID=A0AA86UUR8_9EUKA|nr:Tubulin tyrosine ligase [Hexamita inflata]CAI9950248.1 Tubulin tyrosine ligase [Hexamita inflata]
MKPLSLPKISSKAQLLSKQTLQLSKVQLKPDGIVNEQIERPKSSQQLKTVAFSSTIRSPCDKPQQQETVIDEKLVCANQNYSSLFPFFEKYGYTISLQLSPKFKYLFLADANLLLHGSYGSNQFVNHLKNNFSICKKSSLIKTLKQPAETEIYFSPDSFEIRTGTSGQQDETEQFLKQYVIYKCAQIVFKYANKITNDKESFLLALQQLKFEIQFRTIREYPIKQLAFPLPPLSLKDLIGIPNGYQAPDYKFENLTAMVKGNSKKLYKDVVNKATKKLLKAEANTLLEEFERIFGKNVNAYQNGWICKPAGKSRGRGIYVASELKEILLQKVQPDENLPEEDKIDPQDVYIVQKYIERPLLIDNKKFDIRCWFLVTKTQPIQMWMWCAPYLRIASNDYSSDYNNTFAHLTNNSIQKYATNFKGNMMHLKQFCQIIDKTNQDQMEKQLLLKMATIGKTVIQCSEQFINQTNNTFELLGFDFLIDELLNIWLLEVNSTPTLEYSTEVVTELVNKAAEGWVEILLFSHTFNIEMKDPFWNNTDMCSQNFLLNVDTKGHQIHDWKLIYNGEQQYDKAIDLKLKAKGV